MPSFRVTLTVSTLRPGTRPDAVLPSIAAAVAEVANVEASDLGVIAGAPRVTIRFTGESDAAALPVAQHAARAADAAVVVASWKLTRRVGGRWEPVAPGPSDPRPTLAP